MVFYWEVWRTNQSGVSMFQERIVNSSYRTGRLGQARAHLKQYKICRKKDQLIIMTNKYQIRAIKDYLQVSICGKMTRIPEYSLILEYQDPNQHHEHFGLILLLWLCSTFNQPMQPGQLYSYWHQTILDPLPHCVPEVLLRSNTAELVSFSRFVLSWSLFLCK